MPVRLAVASEPHERAGRRCPQVGAAELLLDWSSERANVRVGVPCLAEVAASPARDAACDFLGVAIALYAADIAVRRGEREAWSRDIELTIPVRDVQSWDAVSTDLGRLTHLLTRDRIALTFYPAAQCPDVTHAASPLAGSEADCVSMLSGGLDSLAGAVLLQQGGRRPAYVMHRSGNPTTRAAQNAVVATIERHWPAAGVMCEATIAPDARGADALPFPPPEEREPSRRLRSLLFMALAAVTAEGAGVDEVFMCENGPMTTGVPLSAARAGSMSTQSTHPAALECFNAIAAALGLRARISNPFVYETKSDLVRDVLAPVLSPEEIQATVSCWAAGRANRPCGGCVPCLQRAIAMAWAGLPAEAYMIDLLASPRSYVGTDAWGNLVDLLRNARQTAASTDLELLTTHPGLLSLQGPGLNLPDVVAMLRRNAEQTLTVVRDHFPEAARLVR